MKITALLSLMNDHLDVSQQRKGSLVADCGPKSRLVRLDRSTLGTEYTKRLSRAQEAHGNIIAHTGSRPGRRHNMYDSYSGYVRVLPTL